MFYIFVSATDSNPILLRRTLNIRKTDIQRSWRTKYPNPEKPPILNPWKPKDPNPVEPIDPSPKKNQVQTDPWKPVYDPIIQWELSVSEKPNGQTWIQTEKKNRIQVLRNLEECQGRTREKIES